MPDHPAKTPQSAAVRLSMFTHHADANFHGTVHGGHIMKIADEAGAMAAIRHAQNVVVTVCIDSLTFDRPVHVGQLLHVYAQPTWVGHTSIEVHVQIIAEDPLSGASVATNAAYIVYVAVDNQGKPQPVPPLLCETEAERARFAAGAQRRQYRLQQAAQNKLSITQNRDIMTTERLGLLQLHGKDATIVGDDVLVGQSAPLFTVHANDFSVVHGLADTAGKVRIIASVPSIDTSVCQRETRAFNQAATELSPDIVVLVISTDLPFAQRRWCAAEGIDRVRTLSDAFDVNFGIAYGVLIKERRHLRRAVWVVDRNDRVVYAEYLPSLGDEPNYTAVLAAAQTALAT